MASIFCSDRTQLSPGSAAPSNPKCGRLEPNLASFYDPVPDNETVCGLPAALSVTFNVALRAPVVVGANVTLMVQLAPAANELPQVLL